MITKIQYDKDGREIYRHTSDGYSRWSEYDKQGNRWHIYASTGYEEIDRFDERGEVIYSKEIFLQHGGKRVNMIAEEIRFTTMMLVAANGGKYMVRTETT